MDDFAIDFVVTWVDGADPEWKKEKAMWKAAKDTDSAPVRYRDWNLMRYWFRGVEKFAPWVNKIHFITWGHIPNWLNKDNPKLNIVYHEDFIPNECLPTFNSNAIELGMHLIEGLSEHFVYFNDDMFLLKEVKKTDFFKDGYPVDSAVLSPVMPVWQDEISKTILNDMFIINKYFCPKNVLKRNWRAFFSLKYRSALMRTLCLLPWKHFPGFFNDHLPIPYLKSTFFEVWKKEGERLSETVAHRFRDYSGDLSHWLMRYWQLCSLPVAPASVSRGKYLVIDSLDTANVIRKQKYKMVCINDQLNDSEDFDTVYNRINAAFSFLNEKCSFEL